MCLGWIEESPFPVTLCDRDGIVVAMNRRSRELFSTDGGGDLIGRSLLDCHPPAAREKLLKLLTEQGTNTYTIEKRGVRKLIHQCPWYRDGQYAGLCELSFEIPAEMPHFVRQEAKQGLRKE